MKYFSQAVCRLMSWIYKHRVYALSLALIIFAVSIPFYTYATDAETLLSNPFEFTINILLGVLLALTNLVVSLVGKLIVLLLGAIIIPILGYNNFANSTVVDIGWPLVRDIVNMFVIVILLVIAVQTIVGYGQSKWEQQLPRLFLAIVLVNFSRTICLLMVDASQIVMFTFVNALRDIAAGNFMSLFQLNEFVSVNADMSDIASAVAGATGASGAEGMSITNLLMTSYATLSLLFMVLGTLIILTVVYLYRIILIWVLMILSPIAFFMKGLEGIVSESGKYKEWMSMFVGALTLGPILTFFLWLGLAAASSGPIAVSEGMNFEGTSDVPTLLANAFATDKFVSVLIGMILIMAGFKVGSGAASAMGNIAGKLVTEDAGKKMFKGALTMPASYAYRGGRGIAKGGMWAGKKLGVEAGRRIAQNDIGRDLAKSFTQFGGAIAKEGPVGRYIGGKIMGAGGRLEGAMSASAKAASEKARERSTASSDAEIAGRLGSSFGADGKVITPASAEERNLMEQDIFRVMSDKNLRKDLKKSMGDEAFEKMMKNTMQYGLEKEDDMTDEQKKSFKTLKAGRLRDLTDDKDIDKVLSDEDFRIGQLSEEDMSDERVQKALKNRAMRTYIDEKGQRQTETLWDQVERGQGVTNKVKDSAQGVGANFATSTAAQIAQAIKHGHLDAGALTAGDVADPNRRKEIAKAMAMSGSDIGSVGRVDPAVKALMQAELTAFRTDLERQAGAAPAGSTQKAELEKRVAEARRAEFSASNGDTLAERNRAAVAAGVNGAGTIATDRRESVREIIQQQPTQIFKFETAVNAAGITGAPNDITKEIVRSLNQTMVKDMQAQFRKAQESGDVAAQERIRKSTETIMKSLEAEARAAGGHDSLDNDTKNMYKQFKNMERYTRP